MRAHNYDELHKLFTALNAEVGKIQKLVDVLSESESGAQFAKAGAALMERLSTTSLYSEVLAAYTNDWAQEMALEVVLDADGFDMVVESLKGDSN